MPFQIFENANLSQGLSRSAPWQTGISNFDPGDQVERNVGIPWLKESPASYLYYDCWIECKLDSGIVVHRHLPQSNPAADTLGSVDVYAKDIDQIIDRGVNTVSGDNYADTVQRMAHSLYLFCLRGEAIRAGHEVPIPILRSVAGIKAIPYDEDPQVAYNRLKGNFYGVPVYYAQWKAWYTVAIPPKAKVLPPANLANHIRGDVQLPVEGQSPWSEPDENAQPSQPVLHNPI